MSAKKMGLGRGFDSLIPNELLDESFDPTAEQDGQVSDLRQIAISELHADKDQPRRTMDEIALNELAESIKLHGVLQPIVVVAQKSGGYMIVAGERRYQAAKLAGLKKMPALIRTLNAQNKLEVSLIENLQRRDLNAIETATAYVKLRDQFNASVEEIGKRVGGKSGNTIKNTIRLLRLPQDVIAAIASGELTEGQARPLIGLDDAQASNIAKKIVTEGWSARKVEAELNRLKAKPSTKKNAAMKQDYSDTAISLQKRLSAPVSIRSGAKGGTITIKFASKTELEALTKRLLG